MAGMNGGCTNKESLDRLQAEIEVTISRWRNDAGGKDYWGKPLVRVASADDPLLQRLKGVVDPDHAMPGDLLPGARSIIVYFLPFLRSLGRENSGAGEYSSRNWADAYVTTNRLIKEINADLERLLGEHGHRAAVTPATHNFDEKKLVSLWSHKHLGYIAGLGTFGHHHLLITPSGCCGRLGSLVTTMPLPATARMEKELCLFKAGRRCLACVNKCRYEALFEDRFDRHACYAQLLKVDAHFSDMPLVDVCGKCGCEVPCSYRAPSPCPLPEGEGKRRNQKGE